MIASPQIPPVAHSLRQTADDILTAAQAAQQKLAGEKPSTAIHELRVALKRWRALLRILQNTVGDEAVILRSEARLLAREFGRSRDAQTALDALSDIVKPGDAETSPISKRTEATITERLQGMREALEKSELHAQAIQRLCDGLARASACTKAWPLERITFDDIATALEQSYRRARRRLPRRGENMNSEEIDSEDIHDLRKALVTFRYQLELIEPLWPKVWKAFIGEVQKVRVQLGKSNDLVVLGRLIQPNQPLAHWRSRLTPQIENRRRFHLERAGSLASRVFAESPRAFRKRIKAMARAATEAG